MKMADNVETEATELKASDSRASRMARYSAAAAGVAAVSSIEVDAAMIKVIVTDTNAQNTGSYTLDLSSIVSGAQLNLSQSSSFFYGAVEPSEKGAVVVSSASSLASFNFGDIVGISGLSKSYILSTSGSASSMGSGAGFFGFFVTPGGSGNGHFGWFNVTFDNASAFTLNSYGYNSSPLADAIVGQGNATGVPDSGPGIVGLALLGTGAAGVRLLRKLRAGK